MQPESLRVATRIRERSNGMRRYLSLAQICVLVIFVARTAAGDPPPACPGSDTCPGGTCPGGSIVEDNTTNVIGDAAPDCICLNPLLTFGTVSTNLAVMPNYIQIGVLDTEPAISLDFVPQARTAFHNFDGDGDCEIIIFKSTGTTAGGVADNADGSYDADIDIVKLGSLDTIPKMRVGNLDGDGRGEVYLEDPHLVFALSYSKEITGDADVEIVVVGTQDIPGSFLAATFEDADYEPPDDTDAELVLPVQINEGASKDVDLDGDFDLLLGPPWGGIPTLSEWGLIVLALLYASGLAIVWSRHPALASAHGMAQAEAPPLFVAKIFYPTLLAVGVAMLAGLAAAVWVGAEIAAVDVGGALVCVPLVAYLIHYLTAIRSR